MMRPRYRHPEIDGPEPPTFRMGQSVQIIEPTSAFKGDKGEIVRINNRSERPYRVAVKGYPDGIPFSASELEGP